MVATPQCDKLRGLAQERDTLIHFLDWLRQQGVRLVSEQTMTDSSFDLLKPGGPLRDFEVTKDMPHPKQGQDLVHEYLEIDDAELERERRAILAAHVAEQNN